MKVETTNCGVENKPLDENALPRAIRRIQDKVGIPEWTAHDLRRTFATQLGETLNIDPVVIEKCLGHKMPRIMATYNKNEMLPQRRDALEQWAKCIESVLNTSVANDNLMSQEVNFDQLQSIPNSSPFNQELINE